MKRIQKIIGIIAGIFAALGIVLIIVGAILGGAKSVGTGVMEKISAGTDTVFSKSELSEMTSIEERNMFDMSEVNNIVFEAGYGEFEITAWDNSYYEVKVEDTLSKNKIKYTLKDGTLTIRIKGKRFSIFGNDIKAILYVPKTAEISDLKIKLSAGQLNCHDINAIQNLDVNIGVGEGTFSNIFAEYTEMSVGAGEGIVENARFGNTVLKVGVGEMDVQGVIDGNINIDCGVGEMDLNLIAEYTDYNYKVNVGLGEVSIGEEKYSGTKGNTEINNDRQKAIHIKCGVGDVSVEFDTMNIY